MTDRGADICDADSAISADAQFQGAFRTRAPSVSAIVVSYYTGPLLARAVESLKAQPEIEEIIIVDNGNWPEAVERAAAVDDAHPRVEIITGHGNVGFACACNLGAAKARGDHLLFFNPDAIMPAGGVARLLAAGAERQRPWVMGAKMVGPDGIEQRGSRRATLTPWRAFVEATALYRLAPRHPYFRRFNLHGDPCPDDVTPLPVISGACFLLPREDFHLVGGMDENYFLHVEDVDFCLRFAREGGSVHFNPHVSVIHYKSSSRVDPLRVEFRKTASMLRYFRAHFRDPYPAPFLWLVIACAWGAFGLLFVRRLTAQAVAFVGFRARRGRIGVRRAKSIAARRLGR
ncbi:MAG: glycosyltransferase family 2 protein [Parvularculaceae bacterium]